MQPRRFDLEPGERVLYESGPAVVTNMRLLANWKGRGAATPKNRILLSDIDGYERVVGGQDSRADRGLLLGGAGVAAVLLGMVLEQITWLPGFVEALAFLGGMVGIIFGIHFVIQSFIRLRPHTTVLFEVGAKLVPVSYPGRENPEADELIRSYVKAKKGDRS